MKNKIKSSSLLWVLLRINMVPVLLLTLIITIFSTGSFAASMNREAQDSLVDLCNTIITIYDTIYSGDYSASGSGADACLMKGNHSLSSDSAIIDAVSEKTNTDITFFCHDTRVLTTIRGKDGKRVTGTKANDNVLKDVLLEGRASLYSGTMINGIRYFSYYAPLYASDGTCAGMIFVGKPSEEVYKMVLHSVSPVLFLELIIILAACFLTIRFSNRLLSDIHKIEAFLEKLSGGNFHTDFDPAVLKRTDELGEMGRYLVQMQTSLRELVEQDMLTGLNNRRSGEKMLKQAHDSCVSDQIPFCIAIGDIDFFKNVNDTYGHECGDVVLVKLAARLDSHMKGRGFAVRWGGEEFLLVYTGVHLDTAVSCIQNLIKEIRSMQIPYEDKFLGITMTFGLVEGSGEKIEHIIRDADEKLYRGKENGRNRLVY